MRTYVRKKIRRRERERAAWLLWHFVKNTRAYVGGPKDLRGNAYEIPAHDAYLLPQSHTPKLNATMLRLTKPGCEFAQPPRKHLSTFDESAHQMF